jgi:hypothetical protein
VSKGATVKVIDGGARETCPTSKFLKPYDRNAADRKTSYDTEAVLKNKFDTRVKREPGCKGVSFSVPDLPWKK